MPHLSTTEHVEDLNFTSFTDFSPVKLLTFTGDNRDIWLHPVDFLQTDITDVKIESGQTQTSHSLLQRLSMFVWKHVHGDMINIFYQINCKSQNSCLEPPNRILWYCNGWGFLPYLTSICPLLCSSSSVKFLYVMTKTVHPFVVYLTHIRLIITRLKVSISGVITSCADN